jgi:hypothetical protein
LINAVSCSIYTPLFSFVSKAIIAARDSERCQSIERFKKQKTENNNSYRTHKTAKNIGREQAKVGAD